MRKLLFTVIILIFAFQAKAQSQEKKTFKSDLTGATITGVVGAGAMATGLIILNNVYNKQYTRDVQKSGSTGTAIAAGGAVLMMISTVLFTSAIKHEHKLTFTGTSLKFRLAKN